MATTLDLETTLDLNDEHALPSSEIKKMKDSKKSSDIEGTKLLKEKSLKKSEGMFLIY